jgi:hypothetical protein
MVCCSVISSSVCSYINYAVCVFLHYKSHVCEPSSPLAISIQYNSALLLRYIDLGCYGQQALKLF